MDELFVVDLIVVLGFGVRRMLDGGNVMLEVWVGFFYIFCLFFCNSQGLFLSFCDNVVGLMYVFVVCGLDEIVDEESLYCEFFKYVFFKVLFKVLY